EPALFPERDENRLDGTTVPLPPPLSPGDADRTNAGIPTKPRTDTGQINAGAPNVPIEDAEPPPQPLCQPPCDQAPEPTKRLILWTELQTPYIESGRFFNVGYNLGNL